MRTYIPHEIKEAGMVELMHNAENIHLLITLPVQLTTSDCLNCNGCKYVIALYMKSYKKVVI